MRRNSIITRISRLSGLAVLYATLGLIFAFHVSSVAAAPFVYVTSLTPFTGGQLFPPGTVSVIDTATSTVVATISVDGAPVRVAVTPDGRRVYLAMQSNKGSVSVLDTATNTIATTVPVGDFCIGGIAITPDGKHAYVANCSNDNIVTV